MEQSKKEQLIKFLLERGEDASAFVAGGADELTFGALSKYGPKGIQDIIEANPVASGVGRGASFLVPGLGALGLAGKVVKGGGALGRLAKIASSDVGEKAGGAALKKILQMAGKEAPVSALGKAGAGALKVGIGSGAEAAAQEGIRSAIGTSQGELGEGTASALKGGAILGAASPTLQRIGKAAYTLPGFIRGVPLEKQDEVVDFLMNQNKFGTERGFQDYAKKLQSGYGEKVEPLFDKLSSIEKQKGPITDIEELLSPMRKSRGEALTSGLDRDVRQLGKVEERYASSLGSNPSVEQIRNRSKAVDTQLSKLKDTQRSAAMGMPGEGKSIAEVGGLGEQKRSLKNWEKSKISKFLESSDVDKYNQANKEFGIGRSLSRSLEKDQKSNLADLALPALAGGSYIGAQMLAGNPAPILGGLGVAGAFAGARSAPFRTSTGLMLNKVGTSSFTPKAVGRLSEMRNRKEEPKEEKKPKEYDPNNPFADIE